MLESATNTINLTDIGRGAPPNSVLAMMILSFWLMYLIFALMIEIPAFFILGFRKIKMLVWSTLISSICIFAYQWASYAINGQLNEGVGFILAQIVVTIIETMTLAIILKKDLPLKKIIFVTVGANLTFIIIKQVWGIF